MRETSARNKQLNFKGVLSILFLLAIFVFFSTLLFDGLNKYRAARLYKSYSEESLSYIGRNRSGLTQIFADMQNTQCAFTPCGSMAQDEIAHAISDDLKDFSSTAFIAINKSGELMLMRLSGERELLYSGDPTTLKMKELINGTRSELPWDDYTYFYEGKEVLTPFKNAEGKIMGLLMRSAVAK
jgi:hypothetical protein